MLSSRCGRSSRTIACSTALQLFVINHTSFACLDYILEIGSTIHNVFQIMKYEKNLSRQCSFPTSLNTLCFHDPV